MWGALRRVTFRSFRACLASRRGRESQESSFQLTTKNLQLKTSCFTGGRRTLQFSLPRGAGARSRSKGLTGRAANKFASAHALRRKRSAFRKPMLSCSARRDDSDRGARPAADAAALLPVGPFLPAHCPD